MDFELRGARVHAATGGRDFDAGLPAVVFLHGAGMDHSIWALQARYFAHRGRAVLALDLPGHGRSEGPLLEDVEAQGQWLAEAIAAVGLERAALVGHSMGALAALHCAARHPECVSALALLGVAPKLPVHPDLLSAAESDVETAAALITSWGYGPSGHWGGARIPGLWLMGGGRRLLDRAAVGVLAKDLQACHSYAGGAEDAAALSCPSLLVLGAEDRMAPARAGRKLAEMIAGAECVVLPACGHMMMVEKPDETLDALKGFLLRDPVAG